MAKELSLIIPTYNEQDNVRPLSSQIQQVLEGIDWEIIFVDDSPDDQTGDAIAALAKDEPRIRLIRRKDEKGLASAVIEGMENADAPLLAVIDADLQHDSALLKEMFQAIKVDSVDLVIGSRYVDQADMSAWSKGRAMISRWATALVKVALNVPINDPLSGYFMVKREVFEKAALKLNGRGQKILLDLYLSAETPPRFKELPFHFKGRVSGRSKLNVKVLWENLAMFLSKLFA